MVCMITPEQQTRRLQTIISITSYLPTLKPKQSISRQCLSKTHWNIPIKIKSSSQQTGHTNFSGKSVSSLDRKQKMEIRNVAWKNQENNQIELIHLTAIILAIKPIGKQSKSSSHSPTPQFKWNAKSFQLKWWKKEKTTCKKINFPSGWKHLNRSSPLFVKFFLLGF